MISIYGTKAVQYQRHFLQLLRRSISCYNKSAKMSNPNGIGKIQYKGDPVNKYISDNSLRLHPTQNKLIEMTRDLEHGRMIGSADEIQFLQHLIRNSGGKKCIDVGVFTGYSALGWALVIPEDGKVIACDVDEEHPKKYGLPVWKEAGVDHKIDLRIAPAAETLQKLIDDGQSNTFDFAFIDADKTNYDTYYEQCLKLIKPGGIIALDNMLWGGSVADPERNHESVVAIRELNAKVHKDDRVHASLLKLGDGTNIVFKK